MKIAVVGASGFVGEEVLKKLRFFGFDITAISRSCPRTKVPWKYTDLFSRKMIEDSLINTEVAIYLVHSMLPSSRLTQAEFMDQDLLLADNFLRACKKQGVKQIIYLGGIIPEDQELSPHLKSRKEVEDLFTKSGIATTVFRAGLIVGNKGSSLNILKNALEKSPVMFIPPTMHNKIQVVSVDDVTDYLIKAIYNKSFYDTIFNLGYKPLSYLELINIFKKHLNKKTLLINIPFFPVRILSRLISWCSKAPYSLVFPLLSSSKHNLVSNNTIQGDIEEELKMIKDEVVIPTAYLAKPGPKNTARSVQRLKSMPTNVKIYRLYYHWVERHFFPWIGVERKKKQITFFFLTPRLKLLELKFNAEHSTKDRELLFITGGLLVKETGHGRLEFRRINSQVTLCALHDYQPALPWFIYRWTQAILHLWTIKKFNLFLKQRFNS